MECFVIIFTVLKATADSQRWRKEHQPEAPQGRLGAAEAAMVMQLLEDAGAQTRACASGGLSVPSILKIHYGSAFNSEKRVDEQRCVRSCARPTVENRARSLALHDDACIIHDHVS